MSKLQRNSPVSEPRSPSSTHTLPLPTKTVTAQSPLRTLRTEESFYLNHLIQWFSKILSEFSSNIQQINFTSWNHDSDEGVIISASPLKRKDRITFKCELLLDTCHNKTKYKQLWYNMKATSGISNHSCITVQLYLGQYHETLTLKCGEQRAHHAECSNPWTSIKCQMLRPLISCFISGFNWECPHKLKDLSSKLTQ